MIKKLFILGLLSLSSLWALTVGETPSAVSIEGEDGGLVAGGAWDSSMLKEKVCGTGIPKKSPDVSTNAFSSACIANSLRALALTNVLR